MAAGAVENADLLRNVLPGVRAGGFLLTVESDWDAKFRQVGLDAVARYTDGRDVYVLLKKVTDIVHAGVPPSRLSNYLRETVMNNRSILRVDHRRAGSGLRDSRIIAVVGGFAEIEHPDGQHQ